MDGTVSSVGSSRRMTASLVRRLAEWTGRWLLLGAVAFWWGAVVVPRIVSLVLPELLPLDAIPWHLHPDSEGNLSNAVSAVFLSITALLAFMNSLRSFGRLRTQDASHRKAVRLGDKLRSQDWIAAGGWTALAVTAAFLAWEEISEFKVAAGMFALGEIVLGTTYRGTFWPVVASPLIVAFVLAMVVFISKGIPSTGSTGSRQASSGREVRALLILGLTAWVLAILHEASYAFVYEGRAPGFEQLLEETLEFGGTLLIGLSAAIALRRPAVLRPVRQAHGRQAQDASRQFGGRGRFPLTVWSLTAIAIVASIVALGIVAAIVYRKPIAATSAYTSSGAFQVSLDDERSLVQELGVLSAPAVRLRLRVTNHDPQGRSGTMLWRVTEAGDGGSGPILREGRMEVAAGEHPRWESVDFPPLVEVLRSSKGRPLALQLIADVEPEAHLRIGAIKTNQYQDGRLWVNGELTWPDQSIEFIAYMAAELTRDKLRTMWGTVTSDWRWLVLMADAAIAMTLITFIPALLVTAALPRRGLRW